MGNEKKVKGSKALEQWEKANSKESVDEEIFRMNQEKALRKEAEKIRKKVEKQNKKKKKGKEKKKKKKQSSSDSSSSSDDSSDSGDSTAKKKKKFEEAARSSKQGWKISDFLKGGDDSDDS